MEQFCDLLVKEYTEKNNGSNSVTYGVTILKSHPYQQSYSPYCTRIRRMFERCFGRKKFDLATQDIGAVLIDMHDRGYCVSYHYSPAASMYVFQISKIESDHMECNNMEELGMSIQEH